MKGMNSNKKGQHAVKIKKEAVVSSVPNFENVQPQLPDIDKFLNDLESNSSHGNDFLTLLSASSN